MAFNMYLLARFWTTLKMEAIGVHKGADGTIFSMEQYRCVLLPSFLVLQLQLSCVHEIVRVLWIVSA